MIAAATAAVLLALFPSVEWRFSNGQALTETDAGTLLVECSRSLPVPVVQVRFGGKKPPFPGTIRFRFSGGTEMRGESPNVMDDGRIRLVGPDADDVTRRLRTANAVTVSYGNSSARFSL